MRKVIAFMHVSLDGFVAGPNGELEWAAVDEEVAGAAKGYLGSVGAALYGRVTYRMMEGYWPTVPANPSSTPDEIEHARWVENIPKVVFSRTLEGVTWNNAVLVKDRVREEVERLKLEPGGDLMIFGSPRLTHSLQGLGLVDEYLLFVNPLLLGDGVPLFERTGRSLPLRLLDGRRFASGVVLLRYEVGGS